MQYKLLKLIMDISKYSVYIMLIQIVTLQFVSANETNGQSLKETQVSISVENASLEEIISLIENQTEFVFTAEGQMVGTDSRIDLKLKKSNLKTVLDRLAGEFEYNFKRVNQNIYVWKGEKDVAPPIEEILADVDITGKITDENGEGLPGASVIEKGTANGTTTGLDGNYKLNLPEDASIVISFVGYKTTEVAIAGRSTIDIQMELDAEQLEEVVVTSFGIKKTKQQVTYSTQEVEGEDLAKVGNPNVLNGLQGKVAGVSVSLTSGMPGRSPLVKIRGSRSFTGNNQPLYVVDGAPISGRAEDLNPNNIESVNILKGPAASALYGLRASNGVVIITTKSGKSVDGNPIISFDTFQSIDMVGYLPDLQMSYAQGNNGVFNPNHSFSWGPKISELGTYTNQRGEQEVAKAYDNDKAFYQTGNTTNTNVSIANAGKIGSYYIGVGHNSQSGIVPSTKLSRTNLKFSGKYQISSKLSTTVSFNYSELSVNDFPDLTGNNNYFRSLTDVPPSYNLAGNAYQSEGDPYMQYYFRSSQNNPYWVVDHNYRNTNTPRTLGNVLLDYDINKAISISYRLGVDNVNSRTEDFRDLGTGQAGRTNPPSGGSISILNSTTRQVNSNLYATYKKNLSENWFLDAIIGNEVFDQKINNDASVGDNFVSGGWANLANASNILASNYASRQRIVGFYGNLNLGWQDKIFVNASGRNDYVSNMPSGSRSFFYPSLGTSVVLTNVLPELKNIMSFGKLRATVAEVGQAGQIFVNGTGFVKNSPSNFTFPYNGITSFTQQSMRINPDLKPENTRSIEFGLDLRFLDERITVDYTYFNSKSEGQIFQVPLALSTGAASEIRNAGEMSSKGHEIVLGLIPIRSNGFTWNFNTNFSTLENKVMELAEGVDRIDINSGIIVAEQGYDYPSILGTAYFKDPNTGLDVVLNDPTSSRHGMPIMDPAKKIIGSTIPDFEMNFINRISYKNLSFSFQIDWRSGGQLFSQSYTETRWRGLGAVTEDRDVDVVLPAVKGRVVEGELIVDGSNDISIQKNLNYYSAIGQWLATEESLQDASFVRLREVTFNYELPQSLLGNIFIKSASIYLTGRNLFLITDSFTDPEVNHSNGRSGNTAGLEWSQIPQTRSIGGGIRIQF